MKWICPDCKFVLFAERIHHPIICHCGFIEVKPGIHDHVKNRVSPRSKKPKLSAEKRARLELEKIVKGQLAWLLLHCNKMMDPAWIPIWHKFIPKHCDCETEFTKILKNDPPDFSSPERYFAWTNRVHNKVNVKLKKPQMSLEEAERIWIPRRDSLYALRMPIVNGGIERWGISLMSRLPSFGVSPTTSSTVANKSILKEILSVAPECTVEAAVLCNKTVLVSNDFEFQKPGGGTAVLVAHGYCEYTKNWVQRIYNECDVLVGVSKSISKAVTEWTGRECHTIENGVDVDRLVPTKDRNAYREELGIPVDAYVVGTAGRLTEEKGMSKFLRTVALIPNAYGVIFGWGNVTKYDNIAKSLGIFDRIRILPAVEQIGNVFNIMDVFSSFSLQEGFGLAVMEAMMFGLPVCSTYTGIARELFDSHGYFGPSIVVPTCSPDEAADAIQVAKPVIDPSILQHYTSDSMANRWNHFLTHLQDFQ
jgi:hypothetical protein